MNQKSYEIKRIRDKFQCSFYEAKEIFEKQELIKLVNEARNIRDLKPILINLIKHRRELE